jgi:hypothetical protein
MASRTVLAVYPVSRFALTTSTTAPPVNMDVTNGNVAPNDGYTWLELVLTGGVARTVTLDIPSGFDLDLVVSDRTYPLPSNGTYFTGVFPVSAYGSQLLLNVSGAGVAIRAFSARGAV